MENGTWVVNEQGLVGEVVNVSSDNEVLEVNWNNGERSTVLNENLETLNS